LQMNLSESLELSSFRFPKERMAAVEAADTYISVALIGGASLSCLGTIFIISVFWFMNPLGRRNYWLLFWLSFGDFCTAVSGIISGVLSLVHDVYPGAATCAFQGSLIHFTSLSCFCWTSCIVVKMLAQFHGIESLKRETLIFHSYSWGVPLLEIIFLTSIRAWGNNGSGWCWIPGGRNPYRLLLYGPLVIIIIFSLISVAYMFKKMPSSTPSREERISRKMILHFSLYPIILSVCWTGALVNRLQNAINPDEFVEGLYIWEYGLNTLQGFFNSIVFGSAIYQYRMLTKQDLSTDEFGEYKRLIDIYT